LRPKLRRCSCVDRVIGKPLTNALVRNHAGPSKGGRALRAAALGNRSVRLGRPIVLGWSPAILGFPPHSEPRFGQEGVQESQQRRTMAPPREPLQPDQRGFYLLRRICGELTDEDFRVSCLLNSFSDELEFLGQLLPGPKTGKDDVHLFEGFESGK